MGRYRILIVIFAVAILCAPCFAQKAITIPYVLGPRSSIGDFHVGYEFDVYDTAHRTSVQYELDAHDDYGHHFKQILFVNGRPVFADAGKQNFRFADGWNAKRVDACRAQVIRSTLGPATEPTVKVRVKDKVPEIDMSKACR